MTIWFISDTHFHHYNIIKYANRPFQSVSEMNEFMVEQWNIYVKPSDHIYHLGDVTMLRDNQGRGLEILKRCNGHKRLIMGNHDHYHIKHYVNHFEKVMAMNVIDRYRFTHIPVHPDSFGNVAANIHGHIHEKPDYQPVCHIDKETQRLIVKPYINISVERTNYHPISLEQIKEMVKTYD